ncbi:MAG: hypothetical protein ACR2OX_11200, partial [Methyloligellaceae bacterium]
MSKISSNEGRMLTDDEPNEESSRAERSSTIYQLQPDLLDLLLHQDGCDLKLSEIVEKISQTFGAEGCIVTLGDKSQRESREKDLPFYCCSGLSDTIAQALTASNAFVDEQGSLSDIACPEGADYRWYWSEQFGSSPESGTCGRLILLFQTARRASAEERLALRSLGPIVGLIAGLTVRETALKSANDRFTSLAASIPGVVYQR